MSGAGRIAAAAVAVALALPGVAAAIAHTQVHYVMGTYLRITAEGDGATGGMTACFREARRLEEIFSRWQAGSELSRLNRAGAGEHPVGPDMDGLLRRAEALAHATDGAFAVTVGPLTALWRRSGTPAPGEVAAARAWSAPEAVRIHDRRVAMAEGARLDVDGIAKGWAVDGCAERLRAAGVRRALVSLGESSLYAIGAPAGAPRWRCAVRGTDPATIVGWLGLRDAGASVSATYGSEGKTPGRRAHILDPRTGRPLEEHAVAVAVGASATDAEAWTKALLVLGRDATARARARGVAGAIHIGPEGIRADVDRRRASWTPLPAPRVLAAAEEPLR